MRDLESLTREMIHSIHKTVLPSLPEDGSETYGDAMRHVILFQAEEIERLSECIRCLYTHVDLADLCTREAAEAAKGGIRDET